MKTLLRRFRWMVFVAITITITIGIAAPVAAEDRASTPWLAPALSLAAPVRNPLDRALSDELRLYYLRPMPPGSTLFVGWGRDGRAASGAGAGSGIVLEDAAGRGGNEAWMDRIERRLDESGGGLPSASLRVRPTWIDRGIDRVFAPEPIHVGKVCLGFSPYTAWKRRNPLCLLSPVPFFMSW